VYLADRIADVVRSLGVAVWIAALLLAAATIAWNARAERETAAPRPTAAPPGPLAPVSDDEMWG
jgi:hypothetical protein